ncbi:MAG TPA: Hsp20/alpha crystallin family protein [Gemmatimonadaceae bacterium]|nr:Hsp20/alpha crystallin family protein [Gemmatimonadaceae bacterium]
MTRESTHQSSGREAGQQSSSQTRGTNAPTGNGSQTDRQRAIDTSQEGTGQREGSSGLARPQQNAPARAGAFADPFTLMQRMSEDMDRLFGQLGFGRGLNGLGVSPFATLSSGLGASPGGRFAPSPWSPQVETFRRGDKIVVRADLPGMKKEDLHVEVQDDVLTIQGERREEHEDDREGIYRSERSYGEFYRAIPLPEGVSGEQCDASYKDGVLEVTLPAPKSEPRKAKRIQVR